MPKIWFASDLHLETRGWQSRDTASKPGGLKYFPEPGRYDYTILAGDICHSKFAPEILKKIRDLTETEIFYTPGNHEFWDGARDGRSMAAQISEMRKRIGRIDKVNFLYDEGVDLPGTNHSLFMSPWFTSFGQPDGGPKPLWEIEDRIGDYSYTLVNGKPLRAVDHVKMNKRARKSLEKWLGEVVSKERTPIIATHFPPTKRLSHPFYSSTGIVSDYFCDTYLDESPRDFPEGTVWIYGHIHWNTTWRCGNVLFEANQIGYPGENSEGLSGSYQEVRNCYYLEV